MQEEQKSSRKIQIYDMKNDTEVINVINLFSKVISNDCLTVLNKGLSFSPTAHCNEFDTYIDLQKKFVT